MAEMDGVLWRWMMGVGVDGGGVGVTGLVQGWIVDSVQGWMAAWGGRWHAGVDGEGEAWISSEP